MPALPMDIVTRFIEENIVWAKTCVLRRHTRDLWGADLGRLGAPASSSVEVELDDEYDPDAEI